MRRGRNLHFASELNTFGQALGTIFQHALILPLNYRRFVGEFWGGRRGLNPRHSVPQTDALPAELLPPLGSSLTCNFGGGKVGGVVEG